MIGRILFLLMCGLGNPAFASDDSKIAGIWKYDGFFYDGHRYSNPNPDLDLTFTFFSTGVSRLHWVRSNSDVFCERFATFEIAGKQISQSVFWVNPRNAMECAQDPDMQTGRKTTTEFSISNAEVRFLFDLNGKPFEYILKRK